jgi:hypothetical protein
MRCKRYSCFFVNDVFKEIKLSVFDIDDGTKKVSHFEPLHLPWEGIEPPLTVPKTVVLSVELPGQ